MPSEHGQDAATFDQQRDQLFVFYAILNNITIEHDLNAVFEGSYSNSKVKTC